MIDFIKLQFASHRTVLEKMELELPAQIAEAACMLIAAFKKKNKLILFGNGGSAADAQHFAAEIAGRFKIERRALPAIALTTDTSILTAIGNDYGFDRIFSRQVEALAVAGDIAVGISTSGNSPNVALALEAARNQGCRTVALLGKDGGTICKLADLAIIIPSFDTPHIQEGHITIIHILCDLIEQGLFPEAV